MKQLILIFCFFTVLFIGCKASAVEKTTPLKNDISKNRHENIDDFRKIKKEDEIETIYQKVGLPNRERGSGVYILEYDIKAGGTVTIHTWGKGTTTIIYENDNDKIIILE